jgi:hypothetical protein
MYSNNFLNLVYVLRKCVIFCTYRESSDCNVTCHMFILHWIIKARGTHWENILFKLFWRKIKHPKAPQCYVMLLRVIFDIYYFVSVWCNRVFNGMSFGQVHDVCNYVMCWRILWRASVNCLVTLAFSLTAAHYRKKVT